MSIYELVQQMNPWKSPEFINICEDQIGCLVILLLLTKYSELINHDFVESYGTLINENDMLKKNQGKLEVEQKELENQNLNLLLKNCAV